MARIVLKTAKRETSRSRTVVRSAVTGAFLKSTPKARRKSSSAKHVIVAAKRA